MSNSLRSHELQQARLLCLPLSPSTPNPPHLPHQIFLSNRANPPSKIGLSVSVFFLSTPVYTCQLPNLAHFLHPPILPNSQLISAGTLPSSSQAMAQVIIKITLRGRQVLLRSRKRTRGSTNRETETKWERGERERITSRRLDLS